MQKYLSINDQQICDKEVKFQNANNEFCGTLKSYNQETKQSEDVRGLFIKLSDMKKYAIEAIDSLNDDKSDITIEGILKQFFNHFIPDENEKIK